MIELIVFAVVLLIDMAYLMILVFGNLPYGTVKIRKLPKISVIIAAKKGKVIKKALQNLKKISRGYEMVVVTSDRETAKVAKKFTKKSSWTKA